ncbi:M23 family metallopeptidase [Nocardia sp. NPDC127526]|uniref:M23 family metallopeptidase n=1 Tax=Nocardia sp. NPDC127526 TaxID=3345393 RepID=UPI0036291394
MPGGKTTEETSAGHQSAPAEPATNGKRPSAAAPSATAPAANGSKPAEQETPPTAPAAHGNGAERAARVPPDDVDPAASRELAVAESDDADEGAATSDRSSDADAADRDHGFRVGEGSYVPGVRSELTGPRGHGPRGQSARMARAAANGVAWARARAPRMRDQGVALWARRPRSRAEVTELVGRGRDEVRRQAPVAREWALRHRALIAGVTAVLVFAGADSTLGRIPIDAAVEPGVALRVPTAHPLQVQMPASTTKRYLDAIANGERIREQAVVAAAARNTLERAKAEAAAAVAGEYQPWMTAGTDPTFVLPGVGAFTLPARGAFTSGFGPRWGTFHAGIDIAAPLGSPIYAVAAGTVVAAGPAQGFGLWVQIRHDDGTISVYGHMYDFFVSVGERVPAGMQIARIGNRGDSTGPHLHFEIIQNGQRVDPQAWLALHGLRLG